MSKIKTRIRAMIAVPVLAAAAVGGSLAAAAPASAAPSDAMLSKIVQCESGGNPRVVNSIGAGGLFQFLPGTWQAMGGKGLPQNASPGEQWMRARLLMAQQGTNPWYASKSCWSR
jgi:Transglycosylase-like domain